MNENKEFRNITELSIWGKNPRTITKKSFQNLKKRLRRFGQFKPLIINKANVVLGGNMRLKAMQEIRRSHIAEDREFMSQNPQAFEKIWVSVVTATTEPEMLEYALTDNEESGKWDETQLAELLTADWIDLKDHDYEIDRKKVDIQKLLDEYGPSEEDLQDELQSEEEEVTCPKCGNKFTP